MDENTQVEPRPLNIMGVNAAIIAGVIAGMRGMVVVVPPIVGQVRGQIGAAGARMRGIMIGR